MTSQTKSCKGSLSTFLNTWEQRNSSQDAVKYQPTAEKNCSVSLEFCVSTTEWIMLPMTSLRLFSGSLQVHSKLNESHSLWDFRPHNSGEEILEQAVQKAPQHLNMGSLFLKNAVRFLKSLCFLLQEQAACLIQPLALMTRKSTHSSRGWLIQILWSEASSFWLQMHDQHFFFFFPSGTALALFPWPRVLWSRNLVRLQKQTAYCTSPHKKKKKWLLLVSLNTFPTKIASRRMLQHLPHLDVMHLLQIFESILPFRIFIKGTFFKVKEMSIKASSTFTGRQDAPFCAAKFTRWHRQLTPIKTG